MTSSVRNFPTVPFRGLVLICTYVNSITGSKKLAPEDLGLTAADFPPEDLATLGSIHTCDPKSLQPIESKRNAMRNAVLRHGTILPGGLGLVAESKAHECAAELDEIVAEGYAYKAVLIKNHIAGANKWASREGFEKWAQLIRSRIPTAEHLQKQIQFGWYPIPTGDVSALPLKPGEQVSDMSSHVLAAASAVGDSALRDVSVLAQAILRDSLNEGDKGEKSEVTQKILSPIRRIRDKLDSLSFVDPKLLDVVNYINGVFAMLPQKGKLSGPHLAMIRSLVVSLCEPESIAATAAFARQDVTINAEASQQILQMVQAPMEPSGELVLDPVEDDIGAPATAEAITVQTSDASTSVLALEGMEVVCDDL